MFEIVEFGLCVMQIGYVYSRFLININVVLKILYSTYVCHTYWGFWLVNHIFPSLFTFSISHSAVTNRRPLPLCYVFLILHLWASRCFQFGREDSGFPAKEMNSIQVYLLWIRSNHITLKWYVYLYGVHVELNFYWPLRGKKERHQTGTIIPIQKTQVEIDNG